MEMEVSFLMIFQWLVALIAVLALVVTVYADRWTGKKKHSDYFLIVQKPLGKPERDAVIPPTDKHDSFFTKLNTL